MDFYLLKPEMVDYYNTLRGSREYPEFKDVVEEKKKDYGVIQHCPICGKKHVSRAKAYKCWEESQLFGGETEDKTEWYFRSLPDYSSNKKFTLSSEKHFNTGCLVCKKKHTTRSKAFKCYEKDKKGMDKYYRSLPDKSSDKKYTFKEELKKIKKQKSISEEDINDELSKSEYRELYNSLMKRAHELRLQIISKHNNGKPANKLQTLFDKVLNKKSEILSEMRKHGYVKH